MASDDFPKRENRGVAPAPKVITSPDQEPDLPHGTVVLFSDGYGAQLGYYGHLPRQWYCYGRYYLTAFPQELLPAIVLYEPTMDGSKDT